MLKPILIALLLSLLVILAASELNFLLHPLIYLHAYVLKIMSQIFSGGPFGIIIRKTLALFLIPLIVALIPASIYWMMTRREFKYFVHVLSVSWIILATALVMH